MLSQVLGAAEVVQVNGKEVAVRKSIGHTVQPLPVLDRLGSHFVESGLDRGRLVLGKGLAGDITDRVVDVVEGDLGQGGGQVLGRDGGDVELPVGINAGRQDAVLGLGEGGVLITDKVLEGGAGGLEDQEASNGRFELDRAAAVGATLDKDVGLAGLVTVAPEGVGVRLAINDHASPAVADDGDVSTLNPCVGVQEVVGELGGEELEGVDNLGGLGEDVASVLHRVGGDDSLVGGLGVRGGEGSAGEEDTDGEIVNTVDLGVAVDFEKADPVLSVLLLIEVDVDRCVGHCWRRVLVVGWVLG